MSDSKLLKEKVKKSILEYLSHEDLLDYLYALQIIAEDTEITEYNEQRNFLKEVLISLLSEKRIIIGKYIGPNEIAPWSKDVDGTIKRLHIEIDRMPDKKLVDFFWIGLLKHEFKGH